MASYDAKSRNNVCKTLVFGAGLAPAPAPLKLGLRAAARALPRRDKLTRAEEAYVKFLKGVMEHKPRRESLSRSPPPHSPSRRSPDSPTFQTPRTPQDSTMSTADAAAAAAVAAAAATVAATAAAAAFASPRTPRESISAEAFGAERRSAVRVQRLSQVIDMPSVSMSKLNATASFSGGGDGGGGGNSPGGSSRRFGDGAPSFKGVGAGVDFAMTGGRAGPAAPRHPVATGEDVFEPQVTVRICPPGRSGGGDHGGDGRDGQGMGGASGGVGKKGKEWRQLQRRMRRSGGGGGGGAAGGGAAGGPAGDGNDADEHASTANTANKVGKMISTGKTGGRGDSGGDGDATSEHSAGVAVAVCRLTDHMRVPLSARDDLVTHATLTCMVTRCRLNLSNSR